VKYLLMILALAACGGSVQAECSQDYKDCSTYHKVTCEAGVCSCTWWIPKGDAQHWSQVPETLTCEGR